MNITVFANAKIRGTNEGTFWTGGIRDDVDVQ